jgi:ATP-dependent Clp endopeptidase proteolytic subunit ClpP
MHNIVRLDKIIKTKHSDLHVEPHIIRISGGFNHEMTEDFQETFEKAVNRNKSVIPIFIDSYGGDVYSLMQLISTIKASPLPIATICSGKAMSCGAMLFMFGTEGLRFMSEEATIMIHDVSSFTFGKVEEIKADVKEADRLNNLIFKMAAKHISKTENFFLDMIDKKKHADIYLTAKECKKLNICNHIGVPHMLTEVKVKQSLVLNNQKIEI